jgi:hypothetical protein
MIQPICLALELKWADETPKRGVKQVFHSLMSSQSSDGLISAGRMWAKRAYPGLFNVNRLNRQATTRPLERISHRGHGGDFELCECLGW